MRREPVDQERCAVLQRALAVQRLAIAGELVTELPPFLAHDALRTKQLVALLPHHPLPEQEVNLLYLRQRYPSPILRSYLEFCALHAPRFIKVPRGRR